MSIKDNRYIAVIDTETNYSDEVISIGTVIGDITDFSIVEKKYYVVSPACHRPAMYKDELYIKEAMPDEIISYDQAVIKTVSLLEKYHVECIFAYNACFDRAHLPELSSYSWYDIMKIAAYRQYNHAIGDKEDCYSTGRLKRGYGAERIYLMLSENKRYREHHNGLTDAVDELQIMKMLDVDIDVFEKGKI